MAEVLINFCAQVLFSSFHMDGFYKLGLVGYWKGDEGKRKRKKKPPIKVDALLRTEGSSRVFAETVHTIRWARRSGMATTPRVLHSYHQRLASILRSTTGSQKIK